MYDDRILKNRELVRHAQWDSKGSPGLKDVFSGVRQSFDGRGSATPLRGRHTVGAWRCHARLTEGSIVKVLRPSEVAAMTFQVWDDETGNIIASYDTLEEALSLLRAMLKQNGPSSVRELAVIVYPQDGSDPATVLEGSDFLTRESIRA